MTADAVALVRAHLRAEDAHDVDAVLATFTEDCTYRIPAYGVDLRGKEQVGLYYAQMFSAFPDFVNVSEIVHPSEQAVFVEVTTERTHDRDWGGFPPTGRTFRTSSLALFPLTGDGLLGGEIVYVDPLDALHKMGVLPGHDPFEMARRARGDLSGRVAIVAGGSGGIGRSIAAALGREGARIALVGRDVRRLEDAAATMAGLADVRAVVADLSDVAGCRAVVERTLDELGRVDVLVNAAGGTKRGPALEMSEAAWDQVQAMNLKSVFFLCQAAARPMIEQGGGAIVNVASLNSVVGNAWAAGYAASKGGVAQLTKSLALEWARSGVRVNAIGPGFITTDMTAPLLEDPGLGSRLLQHIPQGRFGRPEDLEGVAVFLASDASAYLTGQVVYVDGGYLCV